MGYIFSYRIFGFLKTSLHIYVCIQWMRESMLPIVNKRFSFYYVFLEEKIGKNFLQQKHHVKLEGKHVRNVLKESTAEYSFLVSKHCIRDCTSR